MSPIPQDIKKRIEEIRRKCDIIKPRVVVLSLAYNHEQYIHDTLDGFIMQKTDFPFVAIVHDDASTDGTTPIIRKYAEKYPDIILPIFESKNKYSEHDGSLQKIIKETRAVTRAKYIAMCEGDDYWTDPFKLQKQVDFLESHPEYSMCFHSVNVLHQNTSQINTDCNLIEEREYTAKEIFNKWVIPTCSVVMTYECIQNKKNHPDFIVGDNVLWASCISHGKIYGMNEKMGVYRRVGSGWTAHASGSRKQRYEFGEKWIAHYKAMIICYPKIDKTIFEKEIVRYMGSVSSVELLSLNKKFFKSFKNYYNEFGNRFLTQFCNSIFKIIKHKIKMF